MRKKRKLSFSQFQGSQTRYHILKDIGVIQSILPMKR